MSIWDKMYKWWENGLRMSEDHIMNTYIVVQLNGPNQTVKAELYTNAGGSIRFYVGDKVVAQFQSDQVVGVEREK